MRRLLELGKDLAILALLGLAVALALYIILPGPMFQLLNGTKSLLHPQASTAALRLQQPEAQEAVRPNLVSVQGENGRTTWQYSFLETDAAYESLGRWLGEALGTSGEAEPITLDAWLEALASPGVYYRFPGSVPLRALADWLGAEFSGGISGTMTASAFAVSVIGERVLLSYQAGADYVRCDTQLSPEALLGALETYGSDGSLFAFEGAEDYPQLAAMDPCALIPMTAVSVPTAEIQSQLSTEDVAVVFGFNPYGDTSYTASTGARVFSDSDSRLEVLGGRLSYTTARKQWVAASDTAVTETARSLLEELTAGSLGDARLYLTGFDRTGDTVALTFGYLVSGIPVTLTAGPAARVTFTGGALTALELEARTITLRDETQHLMPALQAAALLPPGQSLALGYAEAGDETLVCGWRAAD